MDGWKEGGWMDGYIDGEWVDGWIDGRINNSAGKEKYGVRYALQEYLTDGYA